MGAPSQVIWRSGAQGAGRGSGLGIMRSVEEQSLGMPWGSSAGNWPKSIFKNVEKIRLFSIVNFRLI